MDQPPRRAIININIDELPWYKSPYLWVFILGAITLTLLRPCMRHIPDPLPKLGPTPVWLAPHDAPPPTTSLLVFYAPDCAPCVEAIQGVAKIGARFSRTRYDIQIYVAAKPGVDMDPARRILAYEPEARFYRISPPSDWHHSAFEHAVIEGNPVPKIWTDFIHIGAVWILDPTGAIRGPIHVTHDAHLSELFFRTKTVITALSED